MKRIYDKPLTFIHLLDQYHLLGESLEEEGIRAKMSGYQRDDSFSDEEEDDGWE